MYHPATEVKCLPVETVQSLVQDLFEVGNGHEWYLSPNTIGNLLILDKQGICVGLIDFGRSGSLEFWQADDDDAT